MAKKWIYIGVIIFMAVALAVLLIFLLKPPVVEEIIDPTPKMINEIEGFEEILDTPVTQINISYLVYSGWEKPLTDEDILQSVNDFLNNSQFSCIGKVESPKNGVYYNGGGGDYVTLTTEKGEFSFNALGADDDMTVWLNGYVYKVIGNEGNVFDEAFRLGCERYVK